MAKNKIIIALGIPILILLSLTVTPLLALNFGQTILLETIPVDPIDLFRGQHVILNYKISEIVEPPNASEIEEAFNNKKWLPVYGVLENKGQYYELKDLTLQKPKGIFLKGKLQYVYTNENGKRVFRVDYNLDKYFVPEGTGQSLEDASRNGSLVAQIKVYNGYGQLMNIRAQ